MRHSRARAADEGERRAQIAQLAVKQHPRRQPIID